jgi:hypothetical protein
MLCQWLRFGRVRSTPPGTASTGGGGHTKDALQSEAFIPHLLSLERVSVVKWPFERTDVRFERESEPRGEDGSGRVGLGAPNRTHPRPCVRPLYYDCGPAILHERKLVPMCRPEASQRDRELWRKWNRRST